MKYIRKIKQNEPPTLKEYRETTPNPTYKGFTDSGHLLKKALLDEQGHICAYCNGRISTKLNADYKPRIEVEHYLPQEKHPVLALDYENMLGVCNGITLEKKEHCDKSKKSALLSRIDPRHSTAETLVVYTLKGEIHSVANNQEVEGDIELLNLNEGFLIKARKLMMEEAFGGLKKKYAQRDWTKNLIEKEIEDWKTKYKGKFRPYCQSAIWFLERLKNSNRYPAK